MRFRRKKKCVECLSEAVFNELCNQLGRINSPMILKILGLHEVIAVLGMAGVEQAEFTLNTQTQLGFSRDYETWGDWETRPVTIEVNPTTGVIASIGIERWGYFSPVDFIGDEEGGALFSAQGPKALNLRKAV